MYFEGRELENFSRPVLKDQLKPGEIYFMLGFVDKLLTPMLEPVVYVGTDLKPGDQGRVYFQNYASYEQGITYSTADDDDEEDFYCFAENRLQMIFEYEEALEELMMCLLRRKKAGKS